MTEKLHLNLKMMPLPVSDTGMDFGVSNPVKKEKTSIGKELSPEKNNSSTNNISVYSSEPKLVEYGIDLNKPFKITKEMVEKMRNKGKKGFWESLKDGVKNAIPFLSGILDIKKSIDLVAIANKQKRGETLSQQEKETLYLYMLEQVENEQRGSTFMGKVGEMLSHLPAFAGEFLLTGGLYSLGKNLAGKAATKLVGKAANHFLGKAAVEVAGVAVGAGFRTVALSNTYSGIFTRRLKTDTSKLDENGLGEIELKEADESMATSIGKGFLDGYIESFSEQSGEWFGRLFGKIPFLGEILVPKGKTGVFMTKTGFNGLFEEYAEERLGGALRAVTGLDERGNVSLGQKLYDAIVPGWEQTGVELTTTAIWGGALHTAHRGAAKAKQVVSDKLQDEKTKDTISKIINTANNTVVMSMPYVNAMLEQIPALPAAAAQAVGAISSASSQGSLLTFGILGAMKNNSQSSQIKYKALTDIDFGQEKTIDGKDITPQMLSDFLNSRGITEQEFECFVEEVKSDIFSSKKDFSQMILKTLTLHDVIKNHRFFSSFNLSLSDIYKIYFYVASQNGSAIHDLLEENYAAEHEESWLKDDNHDYNYDIQMALADVFNNPQSIYKLSEEISFGGIMMTKVQSFDKINVNGKPLSIDTDTQIEIKLPDEIKKQEENNTEEAEKQENILDKIPSEDRFFIQDLINSNMITLELVNNEVIKNVMLEQSLVKTVENADGSVSYIKNQSAAVLAKNKTSYHVNILESIEKLQNGERLTTYEIHALTELLERVYEKQHMRAIFEQVIKENSSKILELAGLVKEIKAQIGEIHGVSIEPHFILRLLDRNLISLYSSEGRLLSLRESILKMMSSEKYKTVTKKMNPLQQEEISIPEFAKNIKLKVKKSADGKKIIFETIID